MKKLAALTAAIAMALAVGGLTAVASDNGYHANGNSCDAGHGAFGAFSHHDLFDGGINWRSVDAREDGGLGHDTGPTNSGFSDFCNG
jgi:hypothetical protein